MKKFHFCGVVLLMTAGMAAAAEHNCSDYDFMLPKGALVPNIGSACDTLSPEWGGVRRAMADNGWWAQSQLMTSLTYDIAGNRKSSPSYSGQNLTTQNFVSALATYQLDRIGFSKGSQFTFSATYSYSNFDGNLQDGHAYVSDMYIYQPLFDNRVVLVYGYSNWLDHFYGQYLGASTASSALGPTSVILGQAGLANLKPAPGFDIKFQSENMRWYDKLGVARSVSGLGLAADTKFNTYGLRWSVPNDGTLVINEIGYRTDSTESDKMKWIRGGGVYNKTPYFDYKKEKNDDYTYSGYLAATFQLTQPDSSLPYRGWYVDAKTNYAPEDRNLYTADAAVTLFNLGPFANHPSDMLSIGLSYNKFSRDAKRYFESAGSAAENYSTTTSLSYAYQVTNGVYWNNQLSWTKHPSVTPKEDDAWNLMTSIVINL
ncbi:carbohydrate porin [Serratia bockelmannii]|uniref:carbohydrate porin n=1 Tax=Serratia bockelmannii TaxID=2703793 RepID=UPI003FA7B08A